MPLGVIALDVKLPPIDLTKPVIPTSIWPRNSNDQNPVNGTQKFILYFKKLENDNIIFLIIILRIWIT